MTMLIHSVTMFTSTPEIARKVLFKNGIKQKLRSSFFPIELKIMRACEFKRKMCTDKSFITNTDVFH